jgi:hypothetical protein
MAQSSAGFMRFLPGSGALTDWKELDNKLEAFRLFQYPEREVGDPHREGAVAMALRLPDFRAIWVLEGIAHERGMRQTGPNPSILPDRTGVSTHAGIGTALAERTLDGLGKDPSDAAFNVAVNEFVTEASRLSRPGWEPAALEPFGLVVRGLYPQWLKRASDAMPSSLLRSLYWHGAGRSAYFSPSSFIPLPGSHGRLLRAALDDAPDEDSRLNMVSGLVWAAVLVNLPRPAVTASFAEVCAELKLGDAFRNGLTSALMAWRHMAPLDGTLLRPYTSGEHPSGVSRALWKSWVIEPATIALDEIYPTIERAGRIGHLFRYMTPEQLRELGRDSGGIVAGRG